MIFGVHIAALAFAGVALMLALAVLTASGARDGGPRPHRLFWVMLFSGPALLAACLLTTRLEPDFRLRFEGVSVDSAALKDPLTIGGQAAQAPDARVDDLIVPGLPAAFAQLRQDQNANVAWQFDLQGHGRNDEAGVAIVTGAGAKPELLGAYPLNPGDTFCIVDCTSSGHVEYRVRSDRRGIEFANGGRGTLPLFRTRPLKTLGSLELNFGNFFWPPEQAIYPLRNHGVVASPGSPQSIEQPCQEGKLLCRETQHGSLVPVRSFIFHADSQDPQLWLMLLDPGARLQSGDRGPVPAGVVPLNGTSRRITIHSVDYGGSFEDLTTPGRPTARLRARSAFDTSLDDTVARLTFRRPRVTAISRATIEDVLRRRGLDDSPLTLTITSEDQEAGGLPLVVQGVGGSLAEGLDARIFLDRNDSYGATARRFAVSGQVPLTAGTQPADANGITLGKPFRIGASGPLRAVDLRLERLDVPLAPLAAGSPMLALVLLAVFWAWLLWRAVCGIAPRSIAPWLIVIVAQWLLAIRLLIGIESAMLNPALDLSIAIGANIAAYFTIPLLIAAAVPGRAESRPAMRPAAILALGVLISVALAYGVSDGWKLCAAAWLAIVARSFDIPFARLADSARNGAGKLRGFCERRLGKDRMSAAAAHVRAASARVRQIWQAIVGFARRPGWRRLTEWHWWTLLLVLLMVSRIVLMVVFGIKERFRGPLPIAVSVIYVPLLLLGFAGLLAFAAKRRRRSWPSILKFYVLLASSIFLVAVFVSDWGLLLFLLPIVGLAAAYSGRLGRTGFQRIGWSMPLVGLVALVAVGWFVGQQQRATWQTKLDSVVATANSAETDEALKHANSRAAELLAEGNEDDQNQLRIWTAFAPDRVAAAGTSEAESQKRISAILAHYTGAVWGHGYLTPSNPSDLLAYQADDNLSAIHLMSPFGTLGASCFLLVLGSLCWRLARDGPWSRQMARDGLWKRTRPVLGQLTLWLMFTAAAYMILANLQWIPFTGRNIYLLAALSISDLLEGTILLLIAVRCAGRGD